MSTHVNIHGIRISRSIRARANLGRRIGKLIGAAIIASVTALGGGDVVQAGRIGPAGEVRDGFGLRCGPGVVGADLPWVAVDRSQQVWGFTDLYREVGVGTGNWQYYRRSAWRWTSVGGGQNNQGQWIDYGTGTALTSESFSVDPGSDYALLQYALVDGAWLPLLPLHPGSNGFGPLPFCFA